MLFQILKPVNPSWESQKKILHFFNKKNLHFFPAGHVFDYFFLQRNGSGSALIGKPGSETLNAVLSIRMDRHSIGCLGTRSALGLRARIQAHGK
jgi:hypothetical protein